MVCVASGCLQYITELAQGIYQKWAEIRRVRDESRMTSTSVRLSLVRVDHALVFTGDVDRDRAPGGASASSASSGNGSVQPHHLRRAERLLQMLESDRDRCVSPGVHGGV
jgi:hypothetical protein